MSPSTLLLPLRAATAMADTGSRPTAPAAVADEKSVRAFESASAERPPVAELVRAHPVDPREKLSAYFTIAAAAAGLISDGCTSLRTSCLSARLMRPSRPEQSYDDEQCMSDDVVRTERVLSIDHHPRSSSRSSIPRHTRLLYPPASPTVRGAPHALCRRAHSRPPGLAALLVGAVLGQVFVGLACDRLGRKFALVGTTILIVLGATLGTAAHGANGSVNGLFWCL
jgi:hypothetical protein